MVAIQHAPMETAIRRMPCMFLRCDLSGESVHGFTRLWAHGGVESSKWDEVAAERDLTRRRAEAKVNG